VSITLVFWSFFGFPDSALTSKALPPVTAAELKSFISSQTVFFDSFHYTLPFIHFVISFHCFSGFCLSQSIISLFSLPQSLSLHISLLKLVLGLHFAWSGDVFVFLFPWFILGLVHCLRTLVRQTVRFNLFIIIYTFVFFVLHHVFFLFFVALGFRLVYLKLNFSCCNFFYCF